MNDSTTTPKAPGVEPWVKPTFGAFVPAIAAIFAPEAWRVPLFALAALLVVVGVALLFRQQRAPGAPPAPLD